MNMAELDDIFSDELLENNEPTENLLIEPETELNDDLFLDTKKNEPADETVLNELLKAKGIEDSMIRILDENDVIFSNVITCIKDERKNFNNYFTFLC